MNWVYLFTAALFEMGWPLGFKLAGLHKERFGWWITLSALSMALSGLFLYLAQKTIPISTAYIIWTGIGAVGTFVIGLCFFGDSASFWRIFFALLIIIGIVGIELTGAKS
ncbi:MAG: hypothetical protein K6F85_05215 [Bacteroidales bacterium]|nr:hypothetical protein [Bacteroidales bacterium]